MCEDIRHIGRDMTQNIIFGNGGTACPSLPFWTILSKLPAYNWLYNVIWPLKPGYRHLICGDICDIGQTMIQNMIFGNGGTFYPGSPSSDDFDKGTPSVFFAKLFIFVLWSSTRFYFKPFLAIIPQTTWTNTSDFRFCVIHTQLCTSDSMSNNCA